MYWLFFPWQKVVEENDKIDIVPDYEGVGSEFTVKLSTNL